MPNAQLDIFGESYESRAKPLEFQRTVNLYPEITKQGGGGLMSWPGRVSVLPAIGTNSDRGLFDFEGVYVQVLVTTLYSLDLNAGTRTTIGTIPGAARCTFASNAGSLVIANGEGRVFVYDSITLSEITDPELESPFFVDHLNNQWIYGNNKTTDRWVTSNVGTPGTIDGLNYAAAESNGDILIRPYVFRQQLYLFGSKTIEPWWNTGTGSPPFDRQEGGIIQKGLGADYSIANSDEILFFLADDLRVYALVNGAPQIVSTDGLWDEINSYTVTSDAIGSVLIVGNQSVYVLQFPTAGVTWAYSQEKNFWFQLSTGAIYGVYDACSFLDVNGKTYFSNFNGQVFLLSYTTYDDLGNAWIRERMTRSFDSEYFGAPDRLVFWNELIIRCTVGEGTDTGQGVDPKLLLSYSDDDGRTWEQFYTLSLGRKGNYLERPRISGFGSAYRRKFRLRVTDPVNFNLFELKANVDLGIE